MKTLFKLLLGVAVVVMAYLATMSIVTPDKFDKTQKKREAIIAKRLKDISNYEVAYKTVHGKFATAQELVDFLDHGRLYYINAKGDYTDAMREKGITEQEAAAKGLIQRDTVYVSAKDSLLRNTNIKDPNNLLNIQLTNSLTAHVTIDTATVQQIIGQDTINVPTFQAQVPMEQYLGDLDSKLRKEKEFDAKSRYEGKGYPGMRIGSLTEFKLSGNWE